MTKPWPDEMVAYLREYYPTQGAVPVAKALGVTVKAVHMKAKKVGVRVTKEAMRRIVHAQARAYMQQSNPMRRPEVVSKVEQWRKNNPDEAQRIHEALMRGQQELQRRKTSKLEQRLQQMLNELGVTYEATVLIKPKFIVDIRIGNLIIQADGDYWHGHPRYGVLTLRQHKQQSRDEAQTKYLQTCGYTVARIWESDLSKELVVSILRQHNVPMHPVD